jgi:uncharacterized protein (TIGR02217 family)
MFYEINFPNSIAFNSINSIYFDTNLVKSKNGTEQRSGNRDYPLLHFKVFNTFKNKKEIDQILTLFRMVRGKLNGFRLRDWLDYRVENQIMGVGDGESKIFQMKKAYQIGGYITVRDIVKPVQDTVNVFINQVNCNSLIQSIDYARGLVSFLEPPSENEMITFECEFDVPVRFKSDELNVVLIGKDSYEINNLELVEIEDF